MFILGLVSFRTKVMLFFFFFNFVLKITWTSQIHIVIIQDFKCDCSEKVETQETWCQPGSLCKFQSNFFIYNFIDSELEEKKNVKLEYNVMHSFIFTFLINWLIDLCRFFSYPKNNTDSLCQQTDKTPKCTFCSEWLDFPF